MSEFLLNWVNNELKLSKVIKDLEKDFSNGYYLAEILQKSGFLNDMSEFNKDPLTEKEKKRNFKTLNKKLDVINLYIDRELIKQIMNQEKGIIHSFLYKYKTQISKKQMGLNEIIEKTLTFKKENPKIFEEEFKGTRTEYFKSTAGTNTNIYDQLAKTTGEIHLRGRGENLSNSIGKNKIYMSTLNSKESIGIESIKEEKIGHNKYPSLNTSSSIQMPSAKEKLSQKMPKIEYETKTLYNPFLKKKAGLVLEKPGVYCYYESLDTGLDGLGMDIRTVFPKLKKYGIGYNNSFIPTKVILRKVNEVVNAEKIRKKEEAESHKLETEFQKALKKSIITKHRLNKTDLREKEEFIPSKVKLNVDIPKNSKLYKQEEYEQKRERELRFMRSMNKFRKMRKIMITANESTSSV